MCTVRFLSVHNTFYDVCFKQQIIISPSLSYDSNANHLFLRLSQYFTCTWQFISSNGKNLCCPEFSWELSPYLWFLCRLQCTVYLDGPEENIHTIWLY